ncbi:MAG: dihydrodipicolinate synthase family protein [Candidatus Caldatribacteriaceae bacterium]
MSALGIREKLTGVFAPIVTPFDEGGEIEFEALRRNVEKMNRTSLRGYFVLGTNGEFRSLSHEEKIEIVKVVLSSRKDKVIIAGASCESNKESVKLAQELSGLGVDFISLMPPSFFVKRMNDEVLFEYFSEVAESVNTPVLLYNNPSVANSLCLSSNLIARLSKHPNIFGVKDSSKGNYDSYIISSAGEDFWVLAGSADFIFPAMVMGAVGGVLSLANVFPDLCYRLFSLALEKNLEQGLWLHHKIVRLNSLVSGRFGVSGVKAAMDLFGFEGRYPRKPLSILDKSHREELKKEIERVLKEIEKLG